MSRQLLPLVTVSMSSKLRMLLLTTLVVLGVAIAPVRMLYGQGSDRGIITGLVSDASGAAVPNATVTIINQDTSVKTVVQATGDGNYASPPLILGTYTVQVVVQGFKAFERTGIILTGGSDYRQDVHLELGQVTQTIEVTAASEMVNVENPEVSSTLNTQYYHDLPVVMGMDVRLAEAQLVMQPGYTPMLPNGDSIFRGSQFNSRINGGQLFATENYLDGASYGSAIDHNGTQERQPPYDGIAEMKVIDSNMSAQYGRTSGGLILYTTKSGTSNLHGQAYEYNNNAALNARGELIPTRANNVTNTSGYSMGGPVVLPKIYNGRGKTFFFFAFDLTEARQGVIPSYGLTNPIPDFIQGNFSQKLDTSNVLGTDALGRPIYSGEIFNPNTTRTVNGQTVRDGYGFDPTTGLPLAGANVIPMTDPLWSKVSSVLTPLIPAPDRAGLTYNSFEPAGNDWLNPKTVLVRIDHTLMANLKMSTTFNYSRRNSLRQCAEFSKGCASDANGQSATADPADYWGQGFYQNIQTRNIHQQFDWVIKPNLFNHTTVVYDRWIIPEDPETKHGGWLARTGIKGLPDDTGGSPYVYFNDYTIPYSTYGLADGAFGATVANRWELLDDMTYIFGKQTVKFGGEIRWHDFPEFGDGNVTGQWGFSNNETAGYNNTGQLMTNSGDAFASYLLGQVDQVAFNINRDSLWTERYYSPWAQDEIKVTKKLTLTIGVRFDYQTGLSEKHNMTTQFSWTTPDPGAGGLPGALIFGGTGTGRNGHTGSWYAPRKNDWQPRFGFAYRLDDKTSIRGGYAMYFSGLSLGNDGSGLPDQGFSQTNRITSTTGGLQPAMDWDTQAFPASSVFYPPITDPSSANGGSPQYVNPDYRTLPRYQNFAFTVERQLTPNTLLGSSWINSFGTRLDQGGNVMGLLDNMNNPSILTQYPTSVLTDTNFNDPAVVAAGIKIPYAGFSGSVAQSLRMFPQYQLLGYANAPEGMSSYNGWQTKIEKRFTGGLMGRFAFTWSKFINDGSESIWGPNTSIQNPLLGHRDMRSLSSDDVPYMFIIGYDYALPFGKGQRFANVGGAVNVLVGGWKFSGIQTYDAGRPLGVSMACTMCTLLFNNYERPNRVGPGMANISGHFDPNSMSWLNPNGWSAPANLQFGNASRNEPNVRGPHYFNEDWNIMKTTKITEKLTDRLEVAFGNVFNRHFWCYPNTTWAPAGTPGSSFGEISAQCDIPRRIQIGMRLEF